MDSDDDEFDVDDVVDYLEDDDYFDENVDKDVEWVGCLVDDLEDDKRFDTDDHSENDSVDEFDSQKYSDEETEKKESILHAENTFDPRFAMGMKFSQNKEFREAAHNNAIMTRRNIIIIKNHNRRMYARCKDKGYEEGVLSGCRPFICVDGCHLKGPHGGILLTAVSVDPHNNQFPLAYAVVISENKESWEWFLTLLKEDLNIVREDNYPFIFYKQKGLLPAFEKVLQGVENRFCVRHLQRNIKTAGFRYWVIIKRYGR
ncbi:UNVERIFIED_CONTAM: hypothetical protein Sradi_3609300 [Sesamum radiatum]|uniref:MULE transposase domain-containing protein n=1 Tax=Sesamum radiatum TaxID=300843 RepID=A0AAW2QH75_SESRA